MSERDEVVRPLWKDADPALARRAGVRPGAVRTWSVAAPHDRVLVTGRRGTRRDVLLTTGCAVCSDCAGVESLDRSDALLLLASLREAIAWTWPDAPQ